MEGQHTSTTLGLLGSAICYARAALFIPSKSFGWQCFSNTEHKKASPTPTPAVASLLGSVTQLPLHPSVNTSATPTETTEATRSALCLLPRDSLHNTSTMIKKAESLTQFNHAITWPDYWYSVRRLIENQHCSCPTPRNSLRTSFSLRPTPIASI